MEATGNPTDLKMGQLQPMVRLLLVAFGSVSVFFLVLWTGPSNTRWIPTPAPTTTTMQWAQETLVFWVFFFFLFLLFFWHKRGASPGSTCDPPHAYEHLLVGWFDNCN
jgi:hypothetical protein